MSLRLSRREHESKSRPMGALRPRSLLKIEQSDSRLSHSHHAIGALQTAGIVSVLLEQLSVNSAPSQDSHGRSAVIRKELVTWSGWCIDTCSSNTTTALHRTTTSRTLLTTTTAITNARTSNGHHLRPLFLLSLQEFRDDTRTYVEARLGTFEARTGRRAGYSGSGAPKSRRNGTPKALSAAFSPEPCWIRLYVLWRSDLSSTNQPVWLIR